MISELIGFTVSRTIPDKCLIGIMTGAYKLCGGVVRDNSGQIVAHLVSPSNPLNFIGSYCQIWCTESSGGHPHRLI